MNTNFKFSLVKPSEKTGAKLKGTVATLCMLFSMTFASLFFGCNDKGLFDLDEFDTPASVEDVTFVSLKQSVDVAQAFLNKIVDEAELPASSGNLKASVSGGLNKSVRSTETVRDNKNTPLMYISNFNEGGFVVVSATRNFYPIIAYSEENSFVLTPEMKNLWYWFEETKEIINASDSYDEATREDIRMNWNYFEKTNEISHQSSILKNYTDPVQAFNARIAQLIAAYGSQGWSFYALSDAEAALGTARWNQLKNLASQGPASVDYSIVGVKNDYYSIISSVAPMLSTAWDQWSPNGSPCVAGCTTVAIGQIMNKHQRPKSVVWNDVYVSYFGQPSTKLLDLYSSIGTSLGLNYITCKVSASISNVISAFTSFGYDPPPSANHAHSKVKSELNAGRPVAMSGSSNTDGHMWVCDGYREYGDVIKHFVEFQTCWGPYSFVYDQWQMGSPADPIIEYPIFTSNYHSMNWGWGGTSNGWYFDSNPSTVNGNFQYNRVNVYVTPPK